MSDATHTFCMDLVKRFPELSELLNEHLSDNDELLPHVFMGGLSRYVLGHAMPCAPIVQFLEDSFTSAAKEVEDLIAVSFVENIETSEDLACVLRNVHGGNLKAEWIRQHSS